MDNIKILIGGQIPNNWNNKELKTLQELEKNKIKRENYNLFKFLYSSNWNE